MINYELGFLIALFAFTYSYLLTQPHAMFNGIYNKLYKAFKTDERIQNGKGYHPLFMILIHCEKCIAGQFALWLYLKTNFYHYNPLQHLFFVCYCIAFAAVIKHTYTKYIE